MAGQFFEDFRILVAKEEVTPGTMVTPTEADFKIRVHNIQISPSVDMEAYKFATGHHGEMGSIAGKQYATITFDILSCWGGAATTAPASALFDYACGQYPNTYSGTGWALWPQKVYDEHTLTIWVYDIQAGASPGAILYKCAGCVGNRVLGADGVGKPWTKKYTFTGKLVDIDFSVDNGDIPTLNNVDDTCTEKMLMNSVSIGGTDRLINSFSYDLGNEVTALEDQSDSTGIQHYSITKRSPKLTVNPLLEDGVDDYAQLYSGATGCASYQEIIIGGSSHQTLTFPKARLQAGSIESRDGRVGMAQTYELAFNGWTGMVADADLPYEATAELLQGSRT